MSILPEPSMSKAWEEYQRSPSYAISRDCALRGNIELAMWDAFSRAWLVNALRRPAEQVKSCYWKVTRTSSSPRHPTGQFSCYHRVEKPMTWEEADAWATDWVTRHFPEEKLLRVERYSKESSAS